jgi:hypothetical protein
MTPSALLNKGMGQKLQNDIIYVVIWVVAWRKSSCVETKRGCLMRPS